VFLAQHIAKYFFDILLVAYLKGCWHCWQSCFDVNVLNFSLVHSDLQSTRSLTAKRLFILGGLWIHVLLILIPAVVTRLIFSLRFNGHFPGEPGLAGFIEAKDDGSGVTTGV